MDVYRLHDKYFIVDGEMYLLGGRNSTDLFLGEGYPGQNPYSGVLAAGTNPAPEKLHRTAAQLL